MSVGRDELTNRFGYHPAGPRTAPLHDAIRMACLQLAEAIDQLCPDGRDKSLALTALQETMHWANSAVAMTGPLIPPGEGASP